jgi:acyl carrier protein
MPLPPTMVEGAADQVIEHVTMAVNVKSREEILEYLREVLVELFEIKPEQVVPEANLYEDLDIDSIDAVDLILKLKDLTGRKIQPQTFKHVRTVGDVIDAIQSVMAQTD